VDNVRAALIHIQFFRLPVFWAARGIIPTGFAQACGTTVSNAYKMMIFLEKTRADQKTGKLCDNFIAACAC
jgi:hypothetical protein